MQRLVIRPKASITTPASVSKWPIAAVPRSRYERTLAKVGGLAQVCFGALYSTGVPGQKPASA